MNKKVIYTIITVIWLIVIFIFSSMNTDESNGKSKQTIKHTVEKTAEISENIGITENKPTQKQINKTVNKLNVPLRKCAHATEYAILAVFVILTINSYTSKKYSVKKVILVILFCFIYSLTDEYHQSFVPGRTSLFTDCLIDTSGSIFICIIYTFIIKIKDIVNIDQNKKQST